jgi:hypothetical protein
MRLPKLTRERRGRDLGKSLPREEALAAAKMNAMADESSPAIEIK